MKKKWIAMLLIVALCVSNVSVGFAAEDLSVVVEIPDIVLKSALLEEADYDGDGELTKSEMLNVLSLTINGEDGYTMDTTGLEYATNILTLSITNSNLTNLDFLTKMKGLCSLDLSHNQIQSVSVFNGLDSLYEVDLSYNQISGTPSLVGFKNIDTINLSHNQITEIPNFTGMDSAYTVDLSYNLISSLSPTEGENETTWIRLNLIGNKITDITPIAEWTKVVEFQLNENPISVISPFITDKYISIYLDSNEIISMESLFEAMVQDSTEITMTIGNKKDACPDSVSSFCGVDLDGQVVDMTEVSFEIEDTEIAQLENGNIVSKAVGETNYYVRYGTIEKCFKLIVKDKEKQVVDAGITGKSLEILSNEVSNILDEEQTLWGINTNKVEEIKTNITSYISEIIYGKKGTYWGNYYALDKNNTLWDCNKNSLEDAYQTTRLYENVKDFTERYVLLENGELYDLKSNVKIADNIQKIFKDEYWEGGIKFALTNNHTIINIYNGKTVMSNIENIDNIEIYRSTAYIIREGEMEIFYLSDEGFESRGNVSDVIKTFDGSFYMKTDETVWEWDVEIEWNASTDEYEYTIQENKITDGEPYYLDSYTMLDSNNVLWKRSWGETTFTKSVENVKEFSNGGYILLLDGTLQMYVSSSVGYQTITNDVNKLDGEFFVTEDDTLYFLNSDDEMQYVIGDVVDFERKIGAALILRKDGSIWQFSIYGDQGAPYKVKAGVAVLGDVSDDDKVSMKDVQMVFSYISGKMELTEPQLLAADVNGDGKVSTNDMQRIFYYVNGKIAEL